MKPLQMLDLLMLWIARVYATFCAGVGLLAIPTVIHIANGTFGALFAVIMTIMALMFLGWAIGLWQLGNPLVRAYLLVTNSLWVVFLFCNLFSGQIDHRFVSNFLIPLIGIITIFWSTFRAQNLPKFSNPDPSVL